MGLDKKDVIGPRAAALRAAEGVSSRGDYLHYFRRARQEVADSLSEAETSKYKKLAEAETLARKSPPTPALVFEYIFPSFFSAVDSQNPQSSAQHC